jgi:hypothetical protein
MPTTKYHKNPVLSQLRNRISDNFLYKYAEFFQNQYQKMCLECQKLQDETLKEIELQKLLVATSEEKAKYEEEQR